MQSKITDRGQLIKSKLLKNQFQHSLQIENNKESYSASGFAYAVVFCSLQLQQLKVL
jgi:hypothetical protein